MADSYKSMGKGAPKDADTFAPDEGFAREAAVPPNKKSVLSINAQSHPPMTRKA